MTDSKKVPLKYNDVTVGEAEVEFNETGVYVKGHVFHPDIAEKILGPTIERVSFGLVDGGVDFSGVVSNLNPDMRQHFRENPPIRLKEPIVYPVPQEERRVMMNPQYHIDRCRRLLDEYEASREKALAEMKLDEFEFWLSRCKPTQEALEKDGSSGP